MFLPAVVTFTILNEVKGYDDVIDPLSGRMIIYISVGRRSTSVH